MQIHLSINGEKKTVMADADMTLLRYLRDELRLTGTKNGCSANHCGACMVLLDGEPVKSCIVRLSRLEGKSVETIEGLASGGELHPIQAAFLVSGAVQCGFCIPGMILATKALLAKYPQPTEAQIKEGLKDNICRCTGYVKIIDAVKLAARWLAHPEEIDTTIAGRGLGHSAVDYDGRDKVIGCLQYADDLYLPGMLYGKILWSAHPHAEIIGLDAAAARSAPGVRAVLTWKDVPGHNGMGSLLPDQPALCQDRVRFVGDAVALVVADSIAAAEQALKDIQVEYRKLPGVFSPEQGLEPDAPRLHEKGNIAKHLAHEEGSVEDGLAEAAVIVGGHFETPFVEHAYLEPEAGLGVVDSAASSLSMRRPSSPLSSAASWQPC